MSLQVVECADEDMQDAFNTWADTLSYIIYFQKAFPANDTPEGRRIGAERMTLWKQHDPMAKWIKVVNTDTSEVYGYAKWEALKDFQPPEADLEGDFWESEEARKSANVVHRQVYGPRWKAIRETKGNVMALDFIGVHKKYRRQGAGGLLVKWGADLADKLNLTAVIEATEQGKSVYESQGFQVKDYVPVKHPEDSTQDTGFYWMVKEPGVVQSES